MSPAQMLPVGNPGYAVNAKRWLYCLGLKSGYVKIGVTGHPRTRARAHAAASKGEMEWFHLSGSVEFGEGHEAERIAIRHLASVGQRFAKTEWFLASRDQAIDSVRVGVKLVALHRKVMRRKVKP